QGPHSDLPNSELRISEALSRSHPSTPRSVWRYEGEHVLLIFDWDPEKARANEEKHQVTFIEAAEVFDDDHSSAVPDPDHSLQEQRYLIFGISRKGKHLVVSLY